MPADHKLGVNLPILGWSGVEVAGSEERQSSEMIGEFSCLNTDKENLWP